VSSLDQQTASRRKVTTLLLNCDLGEYAPEAGTTSADSPDCKVMPHIDQANIACGMHAGNPLTMRRTLALARHYGVTVGAHPGYADLTHFGRLSIAHTPEELVALIHYQVSALAGMAAAMGLRVDYVKPHGALYNDMMANADVRQTLMAAIAELAGNPRLMLLATADADQHRKEARFHGIELLFETFADRCYGDNGQLLPRALPGAVHSREKMLNQVRQLREDNSVTTVNGRILPITADTLCVHGDNAEAVADIRTIRALIRGEQP
jgi:UPF0271 protein